MNECFPRLAPIDSARTTPSRVTAGSLTGMDTDRSGAQPSITELSERISRHIEPGTAPLLDISALRWQAADTVHSGEQPGR